MRATAMGIALLLLDAMNLPATPLDANERTRVLQLQEDFRSGKFGSCLWVEVDGWEWFVLDVSGGKVNLFSQDARLLVKEIDLNNLGELATIKRVVNNRHCYD